MGATLTPVKTVIRHDRAPLRKPEMTSQGFLRADGLFARAGIYEYRNDDGSTRKELRPIEEVHDPASLASYGDAPVTIGHPDQEVTAANVKRYEVGTVSGTARADGDSVAGTVVVKDGSAIKKVQGGLHELSPGYRIDLDEAPGYDKRYAYPGNEAGKYDVIQRKIRVNHLAIVPRARGGASIRLRMDAAEQIEDFRHDASLSPAERKDLSTTDYAVPESSALPIKDADQIQATMNRFGGYAFKTESQKKAAYGRILRRAHSLRVDSARFAGQWGARLDGGGKMTTIVDGHQHLIDIDSCYGPKMSGCTTWSVSDNEKSEHGHSHDWIRNADGSIAIGMSEGHTHAILDDAAMATLTPGPRYDSNFDLHGRRSESRLMDDKELIRSLREQVTALEAKLVPATEKAAKGEARADAAEATVLTLRGEITELRSQIAGAADAMETEAIRREVARADALEKELRVREDSISGLVEERVALERKAAVVLQDVSFRGMPARQIWATVVKRLDSAADIGPSISDAYLEGRFDSLLDMHARNARSHRQLSDVITETSRTREDKETKTLEEQRREFRNRGNAPLPNSREAQNTRGRV